MFVAIYVSSNVCLQPCMSVPVYVSSQVCLYMGSTVHCYLHAWLLTCILVDRYYKVNWRLKWLYKRSHVLYCVLLQLVHCLDVPNHGKLYASKTGNVQQDIDRDRSHVWHYLSVPGNWFRLAERVCGCAPHPSNYVKTEFNNHFFFIELCMLA